MLEYSARKIAVLTAALLSAACSSESITGTDLDATLGPLSASAVVSGPFSTVLPDGPIVTATDARNRALVIFPGATITDVDLNDTERGLTVAEVKLRPAGGGGEVKLHFALANGRLAEAESEDSPFTYSFAPGGEFVSLAQAIAAATGGSGKAGSVTEWQLQLEGTSRWQYRIWVTASDGEWRIRVDARSGVVNRIQDR